MRSATACEQPEDTARGGESSDGESSSDSSGAVVHEKAPKLLLAEMPRRMVPSGDSNAHDASTRVTRACTEAAALPTSQMKHCVQMLCCAPQARKICTKKVKVVPK